MFLQTSSRTPCASQLRAIFANVCSSFCLSTLFTIMLQGVLGATCNLNQHMRDGSRCNPVGFFLFLVCSIYKCFCKHHHAPPARHNCELFLPTFAAASVSQRFSPLCFKVFSALHATWTNTCETEADATHSCSESFVPFLEERVTCLAQTFFVNRPRPHVFVNHLQD